MTLSPKRTGRINGSSDYRIMRLVSHDNNNGAVVSQ